MNPSNNQPAIQPTPGPVGNGQSVSQFGAQDIKPIQPKVKKSNGKALIIGGIGVVAIAALAVGLFFVFRNKNDNNIDLEEDNKITLYSERAAKVNPMNYELSEQDNDEANMKASQYLDAQDMDTDALLKYFKDKIDAELKKNNTDEALKLLWKEQDLLQARGFNDLVLKILLEMDTSKLVNFQKIFLYRAIVTASVMADDSETQQKYEALVNELDDPSQYIIPMNDSDVVVDGQPGENIEEFEDDNI